MNKSLWIISSKGKSYEKLNEDITTDVLIVGGGIVGVSLAYLLNQRGVQVTLVDGRKIGWGSSGKNTGKITSQHGMIYSKIQEMYGFDTAIGYYEENKKALNLIEKIINDNKIQCDFERISSYIYTEKEELVESIRKEEEICKKLYIDCEFHENIDLPLNIKGALSFKNQGQFNPKKYIDSLVTIIEKKGVKIYEYTQIIDLHKGEVCEVKTRNGNIIKARDVVISSHAPWYDDLELYFVKQKPERSYVVAGEYKGKFPRGTFVNIENPRRSLRLYESKDERLLLIGGENHKVGQGNNDKCYYDLLKSFGKERFNIEEFKYKWSAQDYITPDNIPYIGYLTIEDENIYVATGFNKWGMTNGTVAASILNDMITLNLLNKEGIYSPYRKGLLNLNLVKENVNVLIEYIKGKIKSGDKKFPENPGEGKVVEIDDSKYGAYIDYDKNLHLVDTTCTHLGCELLFNNEEKTWDCPCHGSRFDYTGKVLEGPATNPLKKYGQGGNDINPHIFVNKNK